MSSLEQRLYDHEEQPPRETWERIASALDDSALSDSFPSRLREMEIVPPAAAWDRIQSGLDFSTGDSFHRRLYDLEINPPATAWNRIVNEIDTPVEEAPVVPIARRAQPWLRYAAAAAIIAAVVFGINRYSNTSSEKTGIAAIPKGSATAPASSIPSTGKAETTFSNTGTTTVTGNPGLVAKAEVATRSTTRKPNSARAARYSVSNDIDPAQSIYAYEDHVPNLADRYVMLMTPDGNIIRMSKKWSELLCCVSGAEQDPDCKDQLKKWQEKMATSSLAPSPGNFMDILGLVNSLNESSEL